MKKTKKNLQITYQKQTDNLELLLSGALTKTTANQLYTTLQQTIHTHTDQIISVNLNAIAQADVAGMVTLITLQHTYPKIQITHIPEDIDPLYQTLKKQAREDQPSNPDRKPPGSIAAVGQWMTDRWQLFNHSLTHFGEMVFYLFRLMGKPKTLSLKKCCYYLEDMGPKSVPLVVLIGLLFGVILAFQSAVQLELFGAEIYVANLVSISLIRELGPLLVAIVMMGRSASAYAAELGAMKVNQEIDALHTMALDPIPFLILPRLVAALCAAPLLTLLMNASGMLGCLLLMRTHGYTLPLIIQQMFTYLKPGDLISGLLKSMVFGVLVIGIGCINGLNAARDARAVGRAATQTVVQCIVMITVVDGVFTALFYYLGI